MAKKITISVQGVIAGILGPCKAGPAAVVLERGARPIQQGASQPPTSKATQTGNAGQTSWSGASHQSQEDGLNLIIGVVSRQQAVAFLDMLFEQTIAGMPRGGFLIAG